MPVSSASTCCCPGWWWSWRATGAARFRVLCRATSTVEVLTACARIDGAVGVSGVARSVVELNESYRDARTAARLGGSFLSFSDPDGNGWLVQEVKRAPTL